MGGQPDELFDVVDDPGELHDFIERQPQMASELEGLIEEFVAHAEARRPAAWEAAQHQLQEDSELVERLRGLGYLG